jgi:hypothetical protein
MSNEEFRLPLACNYISTLHFAEFNRIIFQLSNSDLECPVIALYRTLKPSIDPIKVKGIELNLNAVKAVFASRIQSLYFYNFIPF